MKTKKFLYGLLIFVGVLAAAIIVITITVPAEQANKQAANTACVARSLTGVPLVNGLGKGVKIPLFPGATRLTFADSGAAQYQARAYDSEILGFYEDRLRDLCWQKQEQRPNQVVYKNDGQELKLSLLPNPAGKTVIDYVVFTESNVLGQLRIAQTACTSEQMYCNGSCVPMGTSCQPPTSASSCTGGTVYCPSSGGGSGWCQYGSCPSSTSSGTYEDTQVKCTDYVDNDGDGLIDSADPGCSAYSSSGSWPTDQATCSSRGYFWCTTSGSTSGGWCQSTTCASTTGNYEDTQAKCTDGIDNDGDSLIDSADPGCSAYSSSGSWPTDQATCSSRAYFWCTPSGGGSGWCQSTACSTSGTYEDTQVKCTDHVDNDGDGLIDSADPGCSSFSTTTSTSCSSGYYWCPSTNSCVTSSQSCSSTNTSNTSTYAGDANSCPGFAYSRWDSTGRRYCQLNNERRCDYNYPSYLTNGSNYTATNCPATDTTGGNYASCPAGQYSCNGSCVNNSASCSATAWPTDQASCTSQAKFWCAPSGGGSSWCQSTACSTNYSTTTCAAGQWQCNNACISTTASCNGYNYNGTSVTPPSGTTCAAGYTWCASSQNCVNAVQPCYPSTTQTQPTQPTTQQQPTTACGNGTYWCPSSNGCVPSGSSCGTGTAQTSDQYQRQPQDYRGPNDQYGPGQHNQGPSEADMKRQEEQEKRMREQQFQQMKRGMNQFSRGVTQMKQFVDRAKARLAKQGVGLPLELTNAMAKAPELLAKLKAAKTQEEFEDLMGDMQDIGMIMQEWGPKMGELERLGQMLSQISRDLRNMSTNFSRVKRAAARRPELADALKEVEAMLGMMGKKAADAKVLAKSDPEGALELVEDFYGNSEEYWNTVAIVDMVSNVTRGLSQANNEIKRAETRIRNLERSKQADKETIATLKEMLTAIKESLPDLRTVLARRPVDYEEIKFAAESFWEQIQEFENLLSEQGQGFYAPTVKSGQGINIDIPEGFLSSSSGPGGEGPGGPGGFGPGPGGPGGF